jgi:hypothetical protein
MALVSQIYNLPGQWTDLVFWWCVLAVPLAWVFQSHAVAIGYLLGIATWAIAESSGASFMQAQEADLRLWFSLLLAGGILPLWPGLDLRQRPPLGTRYVLAGSALIGFWSVAHQVGGWPVRGFFWMAMLTSAIVMLFPLDREGVAEPLARKPQVLFGGIAIVFMALAATYEYPARELLRAVESALSLSWCWLLGLILVVFGALAFRKGRYAVLAVAGLSLVPLPVYAIATLPEGGWPLAITYSLVLLVTAVVLIALELLGRQGAARIGAALLTILVILRMADADLSLLTKGIAFIVIGCGFLGFNAFISRHRAAAVTRGSAV